MKQLFEHAGRWIQADYRQYPLRFVLELSAWAMSIGCTVWMGWTLPQPPFVYLYPLFMAQCGIFAWAAWTRGSTGMIANYLLIVAIDLIAYTRMIQQ
jgi:hypothetical protein